MIIFAFEKEEISLAVESRGKKERKQTRFVCLLEYSKRIECPRLIFVIASSHFRKVK